MADTTPDIDWLAHAATSNPDTTALVDDDGTRLSYADLDALVATRCDRLRDSGAGAGTIRLVEVGLADRNVIAELWAAWRLGVVPLVVDRDLPLLARSPELVGTWLAMTAPSVHRFVVTVDS